ncbi:gluconate 2-dehydrogenase subunit 3 family protein [Gramella sp. BOM4]|nr:gluconate 2-dehydrogenase subunit 3 family protein [Christiangramia bathymodioli]
MKRRESLKYIVLGSAAATMPLQGCENEVKTEKVVEPKKSLPAYGRTEEEKDHDEQLLEKQFFNEHETQTLGILCALILPANEEFGSATDAGSVEFIEFMAKDYPPFQTPLRGGLMWLDHEANSRFDKDFNSLEENEQKSILDDIAFEVEKDESTHLAQGRKFFALMRNLTLTGYFTSEMGIKDIGYKGNRPNVWDGVPQEFLDQHGVSYEPEWLEKCIDQSKRMIQAEWDENGNLIT